MYISEDTVLAEVTSLQACLAVGIPLSCHSEQTWSVLSGYNMHLLGWVGPTLQAGPGKLRPGMPWGLLHQGCHVYSCHFSYPKWEHQSRCNEWGRVLTKSSGGSRAGPLPMLPPTDTSTLCAEQSLVEHCGPNSKENGALA